MVAVAERTQSQEKPKLAGFWPLSEIPIDRAHLVESARNRLDTASHEFGHWLVSKFHGVGVKEVVCGDDWGVTVTDGTGSIRQMQSILGAGLVHGGGIAMDMYMLQRLYYDYGGLSPADAKDDAANIMSGLHDRIFKKCVELLAIMGRASGGAMDAILQRASLEVQAEDEQKNNPMIMELGKEFDPRDQKIDMGDSKEVMVIVSRKDKPTQLIRLNVKKEGRVCPECRGEDGHTTECQQLFDPKQEEYLARPKIIRPDFTPKTESSRLKPAA